MNLSVYVIKEHDMLAAYMKTQVLQICYTA